MTKLYIGTYYEVHDVITLDLLIVLTPAGVLLIISYMQVAVLCDKGTSPLIPSSVIFVPFKETHAERKRKILKDEKKHHGAVDKSSSEHNSLVNRMQLLLLYEKSGAMLLVLVGLMAGRLAGRKLDDALVDLEILKFFTDHIIRISRCLSVVIVLLMHFGQFFR